MSSILDALRKLEKEKTERGEVLSTAVAGDILRLESRRPRRWLLPLILFCAGLLLFAIVALFLSPPPAVVSPVASPPAPVIPAVVTPAPMAPPIVDTAQPSAPAVVRQPVAAPSDLPVLSGIAYQAQREARVAILNDLPSMEGDEIGGYRLREILPDRVLLERHGRLYPLSLPAGE